MVGKFIIKIGRALVSPTSFIWGAILLSLIGALLIWFEDSKTELSPSASTLDVKVNWESKKIDEPLEGRISSERIDLKRQSDTLLQDQRKEEKDSALRTTEEINKNVKDSILKKELEEIDINKPISTKDKHPDSRKIAVKEIKNPKVSLILSGLGWTVPLCDKAIEKLKPTITLSFIPYVPNVEKYIDKARSKKHEVLLAIPMEAMELQQAEAGPQTLLTGVPVQDNLKRLHWALSKAKGCVGVCNYLGSRFTAVKKDLTPILKEIHKQGYLFLDTKASNRSQVSDLAYILNLKHSVSDITVELRDSHEVFIEKMEKLIELATTSGSSVGVIDVSPHRLDQLIDWQNSIEEEDFQLAPLSEIAIIPDPLPKSKAFDHASVQKDMSSSRQESSEVSSESNDTLSESNSSPDRIKEKKKSSEQLQAKDKSIAIISELEEGVNLIENSGAYYG